MTKPCIAYVGARTTRARNARGNGLNVFRVEQDGSWHHIQLLEMENPSFLAFDRTKRFLYTVHGDSDGVSSFSIDAESGSLTLLGRTSTEGRNPVHLSFDPSNRFLLVANHVTSTIALMPRQKDGTIGEVCHLYKIEGELGPHRVEQPFPKPHQVEFDPSGRWIIVPDKGTDEVLVFELDSETQTLRLHTRSAAREGSGPRHVSFHPNGELAYVINELNSTITAYRFNANHGELKPFQILSALSDDFTGNSRGAEIMVSPDGGFVYASNRGSDTIASYRILPSGTLELAGHWPTSGKTPRFFTLPDNNLLLVANEESDTIVAMQIEASSGDVRTTRQAQSVGSPVSILLRQAD